MGGLLGSFLDSSRLQNNTRPHLFWSQTFNLKHPTFGSVHIYAWDFGQSYCSSHYWQIIISKFKKPKEASEYFSRFHIKLILLGDTS